MVNNQKDIPDFDNVESYSIRLEFTDPLEPSIISNERMPFVSLETEIDANFSSLESNSIKEKYGRIPYGSPLYLWELHQNNRTNLLYIGQTTLQKIQDRFERHSAIIKMMAKYVNNPTAFLYFRLCSRLDVHYKFSDLSIVRAIEHFPIEQAQIIINDIEAYLIFMCKPEFNIRYKNHEKEYWKQFSVAKFVNIEIPGLAC